jgi:hypothetical protein
MFFQGFVMRDDGEIWYIQPLSATIKWASIDELALNEAWYDEFCQEFCRTLK